MPPHFLEEAEKKSSKTPWAEEVGVYTPPSSPQDEWADHLALLPCLSRTQNERASGRREEASFLLEFSLGQVSRGTVDNKRDGVVEGRKRVWRVTDSSAFFSDRSEVHELFFLWRS